MEMGKEREAQKAIDLAIDAIKKIDPEDRLKWLSYFAESVDDDIGEEDLRELYAEIAARLERGGW